MTGINSMGGWAGLTGKDIFASFAKITGDWNFPGECVDGK